MSGLSHLIKSPVKQHGHQISYDESEHEEFFKLNRILAINQQQKLDSEIGVDASLEVLKEIMSNPN